MTLAYPLLADEGEPAAAEPTKVESVYDLTVKDIEGRDVALSKYKGDVLLIVNVASYCGLTERNYAELEPLYAQYKDQGLRILAFPANNFGSQEPDANELIQRRCRKKYKATYDLFAKVSVAGEDICPLYKYLTSEAGEKTSGPVKWNFQKYLVDRSGRVTHVFTPEINPQAPDITSEIEKALAEPKPNKTDEEQS